jgi:hypothetical protein
MSPEEIKTLLKKKKKDCLKNAEDALEKHDHNSQDCNSYYCGKAAGIDEALQIFGMLNKPNHINKNNK